MERLRDLVNNKTIVFLPCEPESYELNGITVYKDFYKCKFSEWVKTHPGMDAIGISTHMWEDYIIGYRPNNSDVSFDEVFDILSKLDNDERYTAIHICLPNCEKRLCNNE